VKLPSTQALRSAISWHRRKLAAAAAFIAVLAVGSLLRPDSDAVPVLAITHDMAGGAHVTAADVTHLEVPAGVAPDGYLTSLPPDASLAAPMTGRSILTRASLAGAEHRARPGYAIVSFTLPDRALIPLLTVGTTVNIFGPEGEIVSGARVAAMPPEPSEPGLLGGVSVEPGTVLLEVRPADAAALATAQHASGLTVAIA
jgi:Flp pilus assembly protein CpaB